MKFATKALFSLFATGCAGAQAASLRVRAVAGNGLVPAGLRRRADRIAVWLHAARRGKRYCRAAVLLLLAASGAAPAQVLRVVATASDTQAVVIRDDGGSLRHLAAGERLAADSRWQLSRVVGSRAVFAQLPGKSAQPLNVEAAPGDVVDLGALETQMDSARAAQSAPQPVPLLEKATTKPSR